ncbi:MAG: hypothetical protein IJD58_13735 [Lachnospiraceae bacterium]|nr:hypothetical protein [Lachnospiraceae bacterium]
MKDIMKEFLEYTKEKYGYEIIPERTLAPDTFISLFGASFISQKDKDILFCEGLESNIVYANSCTKIGLMQTNVENFDETDDISLAA